MAPQAGFINMNWRAQRWSPAPHCEPGWEKTLRLCEPRLHHQLSVAGILVSSLLAASLCSTSDEYPTNPSSMRHRTLDR
jgi:hypothetical protein